MYTNIYIYVYRWLMMVNNGIKNGILFNGINNGITGWCFGTWLLLFHSVGNFIIPTDELIFFRGVETKEATNLDRYVVVPLVVTLIRTDTSSSGHLQLGNRSSQPQWFFTNA